MLPCLQRLLRELVVGLVGSSDDDQLDVLVVQDVVQSRVNGSSDAESLLEFAPLGFRIPLQDGVQGEEFWKGEYEGDMEGETGQASSQDTSIDGLHVFCDLLRKVVKVVWWDRRPLLTTTRV